MYSHISGVVNHLNAVALNDGRDTSVKNRTGYERKNMKTE